MMKTSVCLIGIPDEFAQVRRMDLKVLMRRAMRIEERMVKGVQIEDEQKRYHTLCDRIEYLGNLISAERSLANVELGEEYFVFLLNMSNRYPELAKSGRLMANFCPSDKLSQQLNKFMDLLHKTGMANRVDVKRKIEFYKKAIQNNWSVIELISQKTVGDESLSLVEDAGDLKKEFLSLKVNDDISTGDDGGPYKNLRNQIGKSVAQLRQGMTASVDFSDIRHDIITEILHEFVYGRGNAIYLPVLYGDGSKAEPFPLYCLRDRISEGATALAKMPTLDVGMMSSRHHEMDSKVKVYWFRNQEISIGRTMGETDQVAYEKAKQLLEKMRDEGSYRIGFYQTGFQPAIVGFYRALTEELMFRAKQPVSMGVTPFYFLGMDYKMGKVWC